MVETPHLSIDGAKMKKNIEKMAAIAAQNGVALRPHVKTHKIPALAWAQVEAGPRTHGGEGLRSRGHGRRRPRGHLHRLPAGDGLKIRRAVELRRKLQKLIVGVDSLEGARRLSAAAQDDVLG